MNMRTAIAAEDLAAGANHLAFRNLRQHLQARIIAGAGDAVAPRHPALAPSGIEIRSSRRARCIGAGAQSRHAGTAASVCRQ